MIILGWSLTALANLYLMYLLPGLETIPFHLVWIGLSIIYGFTTWRTSDMVLVLCAVAVTTGYFLADHAKIGAIGWQEVSEVPLMSVVFLVMVWHVHRRQLALGQVATLAESERRRAEVQQLFVRLASHELRTPITVARGHTELLRDASTDEAVREDATIVLEELDKLARITHRLVTLMQINGSYVSQPTDVDAELARIARRWEPTANRRWTVRSQIGKVAINPERLEVALDSLLENAVKFTGPGDDISVTGWVTDDSWAIEVRDSGTGMTPDQAAQLTEARAPLQLSTSGTGLGLAIVRAAAESWGGRILFSGVPDVGTIVTLRFPRCASETAPSDVPELIALLD